MTSNEIVALVTLKCSKFGNESFVLHRLYLDSRYVLCNPGIKSLLIREMSPDSAKGKEFENVFFSFFTLFKLV